MNELTQAQQIFAVFYAIFFGTMLQSIGARRSLPKKSENANRKTNPYIELTNLQNASLNLFDTPNAWAIGRTLKNKPLIRFLVSIFCLNIVPGALFALIFTDLRKLYGVLDVWQILVLVSISLAPQQIYRLFYALLIMGEKQLYLKPNEYKKFNDHDIAALAMLWEDRKQFKAHASAFNHLAFPLFFYMPIGFLLYDSINPIHINITVAMLSISALVFGSIIFLCKK